MNRLLTTFTKLVSIASQTGQEDAMANFLINYFSQRNISVEKDNAGNVFAKVSGVGEPLFLSAHMDTVEPGTGITPVIANDIVTSKGDTILGADNKSTIAVLIEVIERLKNKKHRPLEILFTTSEESVNLGAEKFDYTKILATKGLIADVALPVGTIICGSPAYLRFDIELIGRSSHAAFFEKANTILPALGEILSETKTGKLDEQTILNIGSGEFGSVRNAVPGRAVISGEVRSFDENKLQKHLQSVLKNIEKIAMKFALKTKIQTAFDNHAYVFEEKNRYLQHLAQIFVDQKIKPNFVKSWSVSDANIFNTKGLQVVNIGDSARHTHTTKESIALADMEKLVAIFMEACQ